MKSELPVSNRAFTGADFQRFSSQTLFLIVDDDENDFKLLDHALKKIEVTGTICWAQDAYGAIEVLSRFRSKFQRICLVLEIQLPGMTGFELVEEIKSKGLCDGLLFVFFLTGNDNPRWRIRARACGAEAFLLKPCQHSELVEIARQLKEICSQPSVQTPSFLDNSGKQIWLAGETNPVSAKA
jgi:CheY-like chemotaxis protein